MRCATPYTLSTAGRSLPLRGARPFLVRQQLRVLVQQAVQVVDGVAGGPAGEAEGFVDGVQPEVLALALGEDAGGLGVVVGERPLGREP